MEKDLAYYHRRLAEEQAAARSALNPAVRAVHHELARRYEAQVADLMARSVRAEVHLVSAA